jgi:alpha-N-arabinofuranosidase
MNNFKKILLNIAVASFSCGLVSAQNINHTLELNGKNTNIKIQPTMYGIFFEDINQAADGGLYAELVKNRSFEFYNPLMGWLQPKSDVHSENKNSGYANIIDEIGNTNHNYARITINNASNYELINEGFKGIGLHQNAKYNLSFSSQNVSGEVQSVNFELLMKKEIL